MANYKKKQTYGIQSVAVRFVSNSTDKVYAEFQVKKSYSSKIKEYAIIWYYQIGNKIFTTSESTIAKNTNSQTSGSNYVYRSQYDVPDGATSVRCKVRVSGAQYTYGSKKTKATFKGGSKYSSWVSVNANKTVVPSTPSVEIDSLNKLLLRFEVTDANALNTHIEFEVLRDDNYVVYNSKPLAKNHNIVRGSCAISPGRSYLVHCRSWNSSTKAYSAWTDYSSKINTVPPAPTNVKADISGDNGTTITISWSAASTATSYEIEYTTDPSYFGQSDQVSSVSTSDASTKYVFANSSTIDLGKTWYFKVRAKNDKGESDYSSNYAVAMIGKKPSAPTTWSSVTKMFVGEELVLYWVHNATDGSSQTKAEIMLSTNGKTETLKWTNDRTGDDKDKTVEYKLDPSALSVIKLQNGVKLKWKVRTKGVMTADEYWSDWSEEREVDIYEKPTLDLRLSCGDTVTSYPFQLYCSAGPAGQTPVSYYITIISEQSYDSMDEMGVSGIINAGDEIYSKVVDSSDDTIRVDFTSTDVILVDGNDYTIKCTVAMDSGLTANNEISFQTLFEHSDLQPEAIFSDVNTDNVSISICPFCSDMSNVSDSEVVSDENIPLADNVVMSVYRINHDGTFTLIQDNVPNDRCTWCLDPHPPLDTAYYRIIALDTVNGTMEYADLDSDPISEALAPDTVPIIIQWNETWSTESNQNESMNFIEDENLSDGWSGSILKLPYNIDVSDSNSKDVNLVEYIGRHHPVSYYGTQLGLTATWKTVIPKTDTDTLYKLRQLSIYMGDCYVREPSGSGYWADVSVSIDQTHGELTIPVTFTLTRVEGEK